MITHDHPDQEVMTSNMETDLVENITKPEENQQGHDSRVNTSPLMHSSNWMYNGFTKKARPKICVGEARKCDRICNKRHDPTTFGPAQSEMTRSSHDMLLESEETHDLGPNCLMHRLKNVSRMIVNIDVATAVARRAYVLFRYQLDTRKMELGYSNKANQFFT